MTDTNNTKTTETTGAEKATHLGESNSTDLLCCPFCGGTDLKPGLWSLDDGEVDAVECSNCYAGAPVDSWKKRVNELPGEDVEFNFEDERWKVAKYDYSGTGYRDLTITLERTDIEPLEEFKLTAT